MKVRYYVGNVAPITSKRFKTAPDHNRTPTSHSFLLCYFDSNLQILYVAHVQPVFLIRAENLYWLNYPKGTWSGRRCSNRWQMPSASFYASSFSPKELASKWPACIQTPSIFNLDNQQSSFGALFGLQCDWSSIVFITTSFFNESGRFSNMAAEL